ncbi:MAG: TetR/AcrR family transcriptional regulator [Desulfobacterales bacterium]|nr:TetR/AcrR family transcriptional regulator [Desulfobacterales bacterium]
MNFAEFKKQVDLSKKALCQEVFAENRERIRIKKEATVVKNLEKIFSATLKISNKKGFQAMSMRDLSRETGMSMGALYAYFPGKEELVAMLQRQRRSVTQRIFEERIAAEPDPPKRLESAVRTHLYLSEAMQPWFYFSFMEAKNLAAEEQEKAVLSERYTEGVFADILQDGQQLGAFRKIDARLLASIIKSMLQDWYLKRGKYARRNVSVDRYAEFILGFIRAYLEVKNPDP